LQLISLLIPVATWRRNFRKNQTKYYKETPQFNANLPGNNICFWIDAGPTKAIGVGYWVFLEPLSVGDHELRFKQETDNDPETGTLNCKYDV